MTEYTNCAPVEAAIQQSLSTGKPALLLTEDGESHDHITGILAGVCDAQGPDARDGTLRFYGSHDDGRQWDVRLRLETSRSRPQGHTPDADAQSELRQAMQGYLAERTTQAATALAVALVTADQARSDAVDMTRAPSEAP
jgi:hypothetical protein